MASCSRILNGSAMLAGAEARSCEMVQGCVSQWRRFGMAAHGQEGESFVLSDLEEAQEGATQGTHDLWTEEGAGTGAHKVPAGERLGRVVIVVSLSGRRGCIEMHGLTKVSEGLAQAHTSCRPSARTPQPPPALTSLLFSAGYRARAVPSVPT